MSTLTGEETKAYLHLYYYGRSPSWALAVAATFLFACITLVHFIMLCLKRTWFIIPLMTGALRMSHFPNLHYIEDPQAEEYITCPSAFDYAIKSLVVLLLTIAINQSSF